MNKLAGAEAIAVLVGTIIGAGVFTLPYVMTNSGVLITIGWLVVVCFLIIFLHLCFGEIVLRTKKSFCLPGYIGHYLNSPAKKFALLITFLTFGFSLLVCLQLGAKFIGVILSTFFSGNVFPEGLIILFLWLCLSAIILSGSKNLSKINFYLSLILLGLFFLIAMLAQPYFRIENLNFLSFNNQWGWLIPYGVFFFALNGMVAVPEAIKVLERKQINKNQVKKILIIGTLIPVLCYLVFMFTVAGVSGINTSMEAIEGLRNILREEIILLGAGIGFLAVTTTYLIFGSYIKNSFINDFCWSSFISHFLVIMGPIVIYFWHLDNLIRLISFLGGMLGGFEGIMILLVLKKAKEQSELEPPYKMPLNKYLLAVLIVAFIIGALCQTILVY